MAEKTVAAVAGSREEAIALGTKAGRPQGARKTYAAKDPGHDSCVRGPLKYMQTLANGQQVLAEEPAIRVMFSDGDGGDEFSTTDLDVQEAIEASPFFGVNYFLVGDDDAPREVKKGREPEYSQGISSTRPAK